MQTGLFSHRMWLEVNFPAIKRLDARLAHFCTATTPDSSSHGSLLLLLHTKRFFFLFFCLLRVWQERTTELMWTDFVSVALERSGSWHMCTPVPRCSGYRYHSGNGAAERAVDQLLALAHTHARTRTPRNQLPAVARDDAWVGRSVKM